MRVELFFGDNEGAQYSHPEYREVENQGEPGVSVMVCSTECLKDRLLINCLLSLIIIKGHKSQLFSLYCWYKESLFQHWGLSSALEINECRSTPRL